MRRMMDRYWAYLGLVAAVALMARPACAASPAVTAAETMVSVNLGVMHTQYHENLSPGDDESGYTPGFGVSASVLEPSAFRNIDLYAMLDYQFDAGNIKYAGHYQPADGGGAADATDRAVFNRIDARLGIGLPVAGGGEAIPYATAGYQAWNRNVDSPNTVDGGEFYHSALFGLGWKFDQPLGGPLVASANGELLGLAGGGITANGDDFGRGFGVTPEERVDLGLDDAVSGPFHVFASVYWQHFNYSGTHPEYYSSYYIYEPFSTTTNIGANIGVGFSFN